MPVTKRGGGEGWPLGGGGSANFTGRVDVFIGRFDDWADGLCVAKRTRKRPSRGPHYSAA